MKNTETDFTSGPIFESLFRYAVPLFFSSLIQLLYSTVDMAFVGRVIGETAAAAVGSGTIIINCLIALFSGLSIGVAVVAGHAFGSNDLTVLKKVIENAILISAAAGVILTIAGEIMTPRLLDLLKTPVELMPMSVTYMRLYLLSLISIVIFNTSAGALKAIGNSKSPMIYQFFGGLTNVLGNFVFLCVLKLDITGAALTTILSQSVVAVITFSHLFRLPVQFRICLKPIKHDSHIIKEIMRVGTPAAIQAMVLSISNAFVQSIINLLGIEAIAAFSAYFKAENLIYFSILAIGQACSAFVSQNAGACNKERSYKGVRYSIALGVGIAVLIELLYYVFAKQIIGFFVQNANVSELGSVIIHTTIPFYFLYVFIEVLSGAIRGSGRALPPMIITVIVMCGLRVAALKVISCHCFSVAGVAMVYPITWLISAGFLFLYYELIKRRERGLILVTGG